MKKILLILASFLISNNVFAVQLVCNGQQPLKQNQKPIFVDCSRRDEVLSALSAASKFVQEKKGYKKPMGACNTQFESTLTMSDHSFYNLAKNAPHTLFAACNTVLQLY